MLQSQPGHTACHTRGTGKLSWIELLVNRLKIITLDEKNIGDEHICCAISDKKCAEGYNLKKDWIRKHFARGFVFKKFDVKHKVFIEYLPAENAWIPVEAPGYMLINCFWVAGQYKGRGLGKRLLNECVRDAKDKTGIIVVSSPRKIPYLADKKFFLKHGFEMCDTAPPYFELLVKKNRKSAPLPGFRKIAKANRCRNNNGLTVFYTHQCPFTEYYVHAELKEIAKEYNLPLKIVKIVSMKEAHKIPSAFSHYNLFYKGKFLTHEILTKKKFQKLWKNLDSW
jgi:GNAT superfamily N-acetyltransferase